VAACRRERARRDPRQASAADGPRDVVRRGRAVGAALESVPGRQADEPAGLARRARRAAVGGQGRVRTA
jgi:hypothetical protein